MDPARHRPDPAATRADGGRRVVRRRQSRGRRRLGWRPWWRRRRPGPQIRYPRSRIQCPWGRIRWRGFGGAAVRPGRCGAGVAGRCPQRALAAAGAGAHVRRVGLLRRGGLRGACGPAEARRPARHAWACGARACGPAEAPAGRWRGAARASRRRWRRVRLWQPSCGEACGCSWRWQGRRAGCARPPQEVAGSRGRRREMELRQRALWSCDSGVPRLGRPQRWCRLEATNACSGVPALRAKPSPDSFW